MFVLGYRVEGKLVILFGKFGRELLLRECDSILFRVGFEIKVDRK